MSKIVAQITGEDKFGNMYCCEDPSEHGTGSNDGPVVVFDAVLHPDASLTPLGFLIFMIGLTTLSCLVGLTFVMLGAWPIFGFLCLELLIIYLAFKYNYRNARRQETIKLTKNTITVESFSPAGIKHIWKSQIYWLKVEYSSLPSPGGKLTLRSHGKVLEIGSFLTPSEKRGFCIRLQNELNTLRQSWPKNLGV